MSFPPQGSNLISLQNIVISVLEGTQVKSEAWFVQTWKPRVCFLANGWDARTI